MRLKRTLPIGLALALAFTVVPGSTAYGQEVGQVEKQADQAEANAKAAAGLVDEAVANRAEIEIELALTIARVNDLSSELSAVASALDRLQEQIAFADAEMGTLESAIETQAVDAYMTALTFPSITFVGSESMEEAMVAGTVAEEVVGAGKEQIGTLVVKRRDLQDLQGDFLFKQEEVASLKAEVDGEMAHLEELFAKADAQVAEAIRQANAADAQYRAALSAVESARAREAENSRQAQRPSPPPSSGAATSTTTTPTGTPATSPPPTSPPTTSTGGGWTGRPAVEQWRGLVSQYFPANRVDEALQIMQCESLGDPDAYNPYSGASGLYQFLPSTWATTAPKAGFAGASPFDPTANVAAAAWLSNRYQELGQYYWQPWSCRRVL